MTDKPTPLKELKVGDRVKYIIHHDNGIYMNYGMIGTIKTIVKASDKLCESRIIWDGHEDKNKSLYPYFYNKDMLMRINDKPNYMDITRNLVMGS